MQALIRGIVSLTINSDESGLSGLGILTFRGDSSLTNAVRLLTNKSNISTALRGKDNLSWGGEMFRTTFVDLVFCDNLLKVKYK